jgi:adenylate kinase family enzyme
MTARRISLVGNAGGGKSLLARELGALLSIPVHAIDDIQWGPNWSRQPLDGVQTAHDAWLAQDAWIIDGWGDWGALSRRFAASDLIVFVDFPLRVHEQWALRRQAEVALGLRSDWPPKGCSAAEITGRLLELMRQVDREMLPRLRAMLAEDRFASRVVRLRSPREFRAWRRTMLRARTLSE